MYFVTYLEECGFFFKKVWSCLSSVKEKNNGLWERCWVLCRQWPIN